MRLIQRIRFAFQERQIRCRNCLTILETPGARYCSEKCFEDYTTVTGEEWQAHG